MDRKDIIRRYKEAPRPAGVYRIRHRPSGRTLVGASPDVSAMFNRVRVQLEMDGQPNRQMQLDWNNGGDGAFDFEVLDLLEPSTEPDRDIRGDIEVLCGRAGLN